MPTKPVTFIFCGENPAPAIELAKTLRTGLNLVQLCAASPYIYVADQCEKVLIMPDVNAVCRKVIHKIYPMAEDWSPPQPVQQPVQQPKPEMFLAEPKRRGRSRLLQGS